MLQYERQAEILKTLETREFVSIAELAEQFTVSQMTIRRDIEKLEADYLVIAVKGGVKKLHTISRELPRTHKEKIRHAQKVAIAEVAFSQINQAKTIYLDAGTTTAEIACLLAQSTNSNVVVITNDLEIMTYLKNNANLDVYCTGGKLDHTNSSFVGKIAADSIKKFNIDLAFISTSGFDLNNITTPSEDKVVVKQTIAKMSQRTILVSDSAKYGHISLHNALPMSAFNALISDKGIEQSVVEALTSQGIDVHLV